MHSSNSHSNPNAFSTKALSAYARLIIRRPLGVLLTLLILTTGAALAAKRLTINSNQLDLIDQNLPEVKEVKRVIERFRGRDGQVEQDLRWTRKVTDVRNWFEFSASERWRADDSEREHYSDSGGKSGGQKEKLAYTILAASLAYQFGLEKGADCSRAFHFVMIDEAFGRGSDEAAEFGLTLFKKMGLQLLIATPLQKIHVIEPHVSAVGFVHNEDGKRSLLRNLTIEEYRAERRRRRTAEKSAAPA